MYQALYRKYRPRTFDDVVGQEHITETLKNQVGRDKLSHAYLFIGTRGTGKTTCAKILAKAVNCEHPVSGNPCNNCPTCRGIDDGTILDVVELDAASNNGVDHVRALRDEAVFTPAGAKKRVYIIDEVHMLSVPAFNALLKIMEEPPEHLMFILATTELKKVPATILSRCQRYNFRRIDASVVAGRLSQVATLEGLSLAPDAAALLGRLADGSMRDGLSLLDQVLGDGTITVDSVLSSTGLAGNLRTAELLHTVMEENTAGALTQFGQMWQDGKDPAMLLGELSSLLRDILLMRTAPQNCTQLLSGNFDDETLRSFAGALSPARLLQALETIQTAQSKLRDSHNLRMSVELCLIELCDPALSDNVTGLRSRIDRLEAQVKSGISIPRLPTEIPVSQKTAAVSPPPEDDRPPWEEDEPERPPLPEEPPLPVPDTPESMHTTSPAEDDQWGQFITVAKQHLPAHAVGLLYQCSGTFGINRVTISAPDFPYRQLTAAGTMDKLRSASSAFFGGPAQVEVTGCSTAAPKATRSLDELRAYDIVKFK